MVLIQNGRRNCETNDNDEWNSVERKEIRRYIFTKLCDSFQDMDVDATNESDETNCDFWPCNNVYTRCEHTWDCPNGQDEMEPDCNKNA